MKISYTITPYKFYIFIALAILIIYNSEFIKKL